MGCWERGEGEGGQKLIKVCQTRNFERRGRLKKKKAKEFQTFQNYLKVSKIIPS